MKTSPKLFLLFVFLMAANILLAQDPKTVKMTAINSPTDSNVLVVIDGKLIGSIREIKNLDSLVKPENIESINIIKDAAAISKYGSKASHGAIEVVLKEEKVFGRVDIDAAFTGGEQGYRRFLERNMNGSVPTDNGAPEGIYTVIVQFVVDKYGQISDIKALTNHGYGMEEEVIRVIKKSPNWEPAMLGGKPVKAYRKQPVTFQVTVEEKKTKRKNKN